VVAAIERRSRETRAAARRALCVNGPNTLVEAPAALEKGLAAYVEEEGIH
jgi:hypothetical protein